MKSARPISYWIGFFLKAFLYRIAVSIAVFLRGAEAVSASLLLVGLEWRACKRCQKYYGFKTDINSSYCDWCSEKVVFYKCIECDRKIWIDSTLETRVYEAMFCEFCLPDAPKHIIEANQMVIQFDRVNGVDNEKAYDEIHRKHKEQYAKKIHAPIINRSIEPAPPELMSMIAKSSSNKFFVRTSSLDSLSGVNVGKPIIELNHKDLKRLNNESTFKSVCPVCNKGILLVRRHQETMNISNMDNCILCGQQFKYLDIEDNKHQHIS